MLQIQDLHYSIGARELLSGIDWLITPGTRVALIGPNGAGKTTLLRILSGDLEIDRGTITTPKDYQIGYLPQEEISLQMGPILDTVRQGSRELQALERQIAAIHRDLQETPMPSETLLNKLGQLEEQYRRKGGYQLEAEAKAILAGLGFRESDYRRPLADFSGGWRMRVYLARLLLQNPHLLLLDEPTNHLDLESLEWLEHYLGSFAGSIVFVSHDRFFIDRLAEEICELERGKLVHYPGNYRFYQEQKALREEQLRKQWEEQRAERERIQRFIDRFRYKASKAAQVQSRIKQLEKMDTIELPPPPRTLNFQIKVEESSYKEVLTIEDLYFKYDRDWVLQNLQLNLYRGEKVALVGVNGAGKTTLTRLIFGQLSPQRGRVVAGERVKIGYYAQHQVDTLNLAATVYQEVAETAADSHRTQLREILGLFQFSGQDPEKKIGVLSGGEKARVSLAKILLSPVNFLIMDEPTNHLDLASQEALEQALEGYDGTLLLISHDRYFLDRLVNRVVELKEGRLRDFEGSYSDYLEKVEAEIARSLNSATESLPESSEAPSYKSREQKRREAEARQAVSRERSRLQQRIDRCETAIQKLEAEKAALEEQMADPAAYQDGNQAANMQKRYADVQQELQEQLEEWEAAQLAFQELLERINQDEQ